MNQLIPPKKPELPTIGTETSTTTINIDIEKKSGEYDGGTGGTDKVTILTFSGNPKGDITRYSHHLTNLNKMNVTLKNGNDNLKQSGDQDITAQDVHYVYVYYGKVQGTERSLLICVAKGNNATPDTFTYYSNDNPTNPSNTNWSEETIGGAPNNNNNEFLVELDKLNDQAIQKNVIHIEKTDTKGVDATSKKYYTGQNGTIEITVAKEEGSASSQNVPQGYTEYTHTPNNNLTTPITKFNGGIIGGFPSSGIDIQSTKPFKVYYKDNDAKHERPLLAYFQDSNSKHKYYGRGIKNFQMQWRRLTEKANELNANELKPYLNMMNRGGNWGEFVNKDGVDVKEFMRAQLKILDDHMKSKRNYTEQSSPTTNITYSPSSDFKNKVDAAIGKVDDTQTSTVVQDAEQLKNALNTGEIKQVVTEWGNIQNIGGNPKNHDDNKKAKDAIDVIRGYTDENSEAHRTIGGHKTPNKASPQSRSIVVADSKLKELTEEDNYTF